MSKPKNILVVDDDTDLLQGLGIRLISEGYQVRVAANALSALSATRIEDIDLVLLDLSLSGSDGLTVLSHLKSERRTRQIPVIVVTARDASWETKVLEAGATAFIQKPVDNAELLATIALALEQDEAAVLG